MKTKPHLDPFATMRLEAARGLDDEKTTPRRLRGRLPSVEDYNKVVTPNRAGQSGLVGIPIRSRFFSGRQD